MHTTLGFWFFDKLDPGDAGWGDIIFVSIWAVCSLTLAAYYCYRSYFSR